LTIKLDYVSVDLDQSRVNLMSAKRIVRFPEGTNAYLEENYGFKPYSGRHLNKMISEGKFPPTIEISPRRKGHTTDALDAHAEKLLSQ
jgi:hypothetical protein